mgnify:CR=1 FL=1
MLFRSARSFCLNLAGSEIGPGGKVDTHAPVDHQHRAIDEACFIGGKEGHGASDILRFAKGGAGRVANIQLQLRRSDGRACCRGQDHARSHCIAAYALLAIIGRDGLGQRDDRRFRCCVSRTGRIGGEPADRTSPLVAPLFNFAGSIRSASYFAMLVAATPPLVSAPSCAALNALNAI